MKWGRVSAGHYCTRTGGHAVHIREYVRGDWEIKIDGQFAGYAGRLRDAKAAVEGTGSGRDIWEGFRAKAE